VPNIVRPTRLVAGAALTAALALVAAPGIAGSRTPNPPSAIDPSAFQPIRITANAAIRPLPIAPLDPAANSAGRIDATEAFITPGTAPKRVVGRPAVRQPASTAGSAQKRPRYKISGVATFYGNGTTAMRLPRGTTVIICGRGGCIERVVTDYGPTAGSNRVVDLYTPDFFQICGCPTWSGTTNVTVSVY
jgi:hypothetical protein